MSHVHQPEYASSSKAGKPGFFSRLRGATKDAQSSPTGISSTLDKTDSREAPIESPPQGALLSEEAECEALAGRLVNTRAETNELQSAAMQSQVARATAEKTLGCLLGEIRDRRYELNERRAEKLGETVAMLEQRCDSVRQEIHFFLRLRAETDTQRRHCKEEEEVEFSKVQVASRASVGDMEEKFESRAGELRQAASEVKEAVSARNAAETRVRQVQFATASLEAEVSSMTRKLAQTQETIQRRQDTYWDAASFFKLGAGDISKLKHSISTENLKLEALRLELTREQERLHASAAEGLLAQEQEHLREEERRQQQKEHLQEEREQALQAEMELRARPHQRLKNLLQLQMMAGREPEDAAEVVAPSSGSPASASQSPSRCMPASEPSQEGTTELQQNPLPPASPPSSKSLSTVEQLQ
eukprot:TRINITY_DN61078_c0_g1_i1.p1 TRINITY_DN61078_c0_g1~~TRINITY_DN61078_c0_g1_i1.p1  ORF type:complete len:417 (-),score=106.35 TRINITY_DN61078_c0_g1_i1:13-1263(-)